MGLEANKRGLSPADRVARVMQLIADELGPELRTDRRLDDWTIGYGQNERRLDSFVDRGQVHLDAQQCLKITVHRGWMLFPNKAAAQAKKIATKLLEIRNDIAHNHPLDDASARKASQTAQELFALFGLEGAAATAADLGLPPSIAYVADLREALTEVAKQGGTLTYESTLDRLGLPRDEVGYRILFRQLNVLAAKQLLLGEPQLCSVVVLDSGIPGSGFYWVVNLPRDASNDQKRSAHQSALAEVYAYAW